MSTNATSVEAAPMVLAQTLSCERGGRLVFEGVNLRVAAGELVWVRGANGSGKTSLLRVLAGLGRATQGHVQWRERRFVYIGHHNALKEEFTVRQALAFAMRLGGQPTHAPSIETALATWALAPLRDVVIRKLSQGQRRRVALARLSLDEQTRVWLLDEPFDALDAQGASTLNALIAAHLGKGGAVIVSDHRGVLEERLVTTELDFSGSLPSWGRARVGATSASDAPIPTFPQRGKESATE